METIAAEPTWEIASPDKVKMPAAIMVPMPIASAEANPKSRLIWVGILTGVPFSIGSLPLRLVYPVPNGRRDKILTPTGEAVRLLSHE